MVKNLLLKLSLQSIKCILTRVYYPASCIQTTVCNTYSYAFVSTSIHIIHKHSVCEYVCACVCVCVCACVYVCMHVCDGKGSSTQCTHKSKLTFPVFTSVLSLRIGIDRVLRLVYLFVIPMGASCLEIVQLNFIYFGIIMYNRVQVCQGCCTLFSCEAAFSFISVASVCGLTVSLIKS